MRITPLASGSAGNSLLVDAGGTRLLIDAGLPPDELEQRLMAVGVRPASVDALFVTHRHADHIRGATDFARRHRVPVRATRRTARAIGSEAHRRLLRVSFGEAFEVGGMKLCATRLAHDAPETAGLVVEAGGRRFGYATDLGSFDQPVVDAFADCDGLFLEFNHDAAMLESGEDPPHLKRRIAAPTGHLSNAAAADLLGRLAHPGLRAVWLGHLSRRNNRPELAVAAARTALAGSSTASVHVAGQNLPTPTVSLEPLSARGRE